jgi:hypothetical protein
VDVAFGVGGYKVELFPVREEIGGKDFDGVRGLAEET